MIKFKHDDTESWSIVSVDCRAFRDWERGFLTAVDAAEIIRKNNDLPSLDVYEFITTALSLGYIGGEEEDG